MIQYIKPSCWEWILAELRRKKEGMNSRCICGGYRYYTSEVYECTGVYRCPESQEPNPNFDEVVAYYGEDEI